MNETADQLAGAAQPTGPVQLHPGCVKNRLWAQIRENPPFRRTVKAGGPDMSPSKPLDEVQIVSTLKRFLV